MCDQLHSSLPKQLDLILLPDKFILFTESERALAEDIALRKLAFSNSDEFWHPLCES